MPLRNRLPERQPSPPPANSFHKLRQPRCNNTRADSQPAIRPYCFGVLWLVWGGHSCPPLLTLVLKLVLTLKMMPTLMLISIPPRYVIHAALAGRNLRVPPHFIAQHDCFRNLLHRFALLPALPLQSQISLLFIQPQIALQNSLGTLHNFPGLQLFCERGVRLLQPC